MNHRTVLYIRPVADADVVHIAAEDRAEPDAGLMADLDVADDDGSLGDESRFMNARLFFAIADYHACSTAKFPPERGKHLLDLFDPEQARGDHEGYAGK